MYASRVKNIHIVYRSGRQNLNADTLSRNPQGAVPEVPQVEEVQVVTINSGEENSSSAEQYSDVMSHCVSCPQCAIVNAAGRASTSTNTGVMAIQDNWG